jgi:hypothetical protein
MTDDRITRCAIRKSRDVRVVAICEDARAHGGEDVWEKVEGPEAARLLVARPGVVRVTVEAVDEDDIDLRVAAGKVDLGQAKRLDGGRVRHGETIMLQPLWEEGSDVAGCGWRDERWFISGPGVFP